MQIMPGLEGLKEFVRLLDVRFRYAVEGNFNYLGVGREGVSGEHEYKKLAIASAVEPETPSS